MGDHTTSGPAQHLLAALGRRAATNAQALLAASAEADWEAVADLARSHGVAPLLHQALDAAAALGMLSAATREGLADERRATAARNILFYAEFMRIARVMAAREIPLMALKGLHLAELAYNDISLRPMSDLDLLVPRARVAEAVAAIQELGYKLAANSPVFSDGVLDSTFELGFIHVERNVYAELHWAISGPLHPYAAPIDEIWRTAVPVRLCGVDTLVMTPEHALLHVCAHLACNHLFSLDLRAICDIARIVRTHPELDWTAFAQCAKRHGWLRGVGAALRLAHENLEASIPIGVLSEIGADALDSGMLADAFDELVVNPQLPYALNTSPNLLSLSTLGMRDRLARIRDRVFVPRAELGRLYAVPQDSTMLPAFYAMRLIDLLRKHRSNSWVLRDTHANAAAIVSRRARLAQWISESPSRRA